MKYKFYRKLNKIYRRSTGKLVFETSNIANAAQLCYWLNHK